MYAIHKLVIAEFNKTGLSKKEFVLKLNRKNITKAISKLGDFLNGDYYSLDYARDIIAALSIDPTIANEAFRITAEQIKAEEISEHKNKY